MAVIFKHPDLADYLGSVGAGVRADAPIETIPSLAPQFEAGRLAQFRKLRFRIDHAFWTRPELAGLGELSWTPGHDGVIAPPGIDPGLAQRVQIEAEGILAQASTLHAALFAHYRLGPRRIRLQLGARRGEGLALAVPPEGSAQHAPLFINLDDQPRIVAFGPQLEGLLERFGPALPAALWAGGSAEAVMAALNQAALAGAGSAWEADQPRHLIYFEPGDVWTIDGRQSSRQVVHGRRLLCIDAEVDPAGMRRPERHYLAMVEAFRTRLLARPQSPAA